MSSKDKTTAAGSGRPTTSKATRRTISSTTKTSQQQQARIAQPTTTSTSIPKRGKKATTTPSSSSSCPASSSGKHDSNRVNNPVIDNRLETQSSRGGHKKPSKTAIDQNNDETSSSSQEMTMTSLHGQIGGNLASMSTPSRVVSGEKETNIDRSVQQETDDDESTTLLESSSSDPTPQAPSSKARSSKSDINSSLPAGWEEHSDEEGVYFWHIATGVVQRTRPTGEEPAQLFKEEPLVLYHDDEEINQSSVSQRRLTSSDEEELESGAALTTADDPTTMSDAITFEVYPTGCCEFDETQLISANSTKAIQKCILKLTGYSTNDTGRCWGLDQSRPILMRLLDDHIQFSDMDTHSLLRSQPIQTMKTWAVDDDNNFAFVIEDQHDPSIRFVEGDEQVGFSMCDSVDYALLNGPTFMCYVFSSVEDDDMSSKVAGHLNEAINRYREFVSNQVKQSTRLQQMNDSNPLKQAVSRSVGGLIENDQTDADEDLDDGDPVSGGSVDEEDFEESSEVSMRIKYIGKVQVPRPMGIDVLNVAIDKSLAEASKAQMNRLLSTGGTSVSDNPINDDGQLEIGSPLTDAKIHVSPTNVIVENEQTGDIIVECRIRYLTFMGISRRDIRWCGFIMQNTTNKTFEAHCIECHPTAGLVCEAIQTSCSKMYEKMVKGQRRKQQIDDAASIMPKTSKIRDTLAKTLSKIKLTPIIQ